MARYKLLDGRHVQSEVNEEGIAVDRIFLTGEEFDSDDDLLALNPRGGMAPRYVLVGDQGTAEPESKAIQPPPKQSASKKSTKKG